MPTLFAITLFLSAALLFLIQPMVGKMLLRFFGGTPAVWNTCMVFFQAALLAGYAYAHAAPKQLGVRRHAIVHLLLLPLPLLPLLMLLPLAISSGSLVQSLPPALALLAILTTTVGLPFFMTATNGPLIQKWFASTAHASARDPYFLYAASNLGSMLALLSYPFLLEPTLTLIQQSRLWTGGYVLLIVLLTSCAIFLWRSHAPAASNSLPSPPTSSDSRLSISRRARWIALAFVPSSLMLSVTTYLTTDIAAIPLLWVLPLSLYLLSFTLVFARKPLLPHEPMVRWMPLVILVLALTYLSEATEPVLMLLGLHLVGLFWISMVCHGEAARDRPSAQHLTEFYLWLAVGGVLGGLFNALLAPLVFSSITEYPLVLTLACLLRPSLEMLERKAKGVAFSARQDLIPPLVVGAVTAALVLILQRAGMEPGIITAGLMFGGPMVVCYLLQHRPIRFGLSVGAVLLASTLYTGICGQLEYRTRSFFGVHRVTLDPTQSYRLLIHGNTVHGQQSLEPTRRREALTYYHRTGPIGQVILRFQEEQRPLRVGVIGLGAGTLASYAQKGEQWTYFEIDPSVVHIARDSGRFTFLSDALVSPEIIVGDARLTLARTGQRYDLLIVDAFSSDAIPTHLLTREALELYREHLTDDGVLAFNISNRYLDLEPILGDLARNARPHAWTCLAQQDLDISQAEKQKGRSPSHWVVMTAKADMVEKLQRSGRWHRVLGREGAQVWTDDFSNLMRVFKWK